MQERLFRQSGHAWRRASFRDAACNYLYLYLWMIGTIEGYRSQLYHSKSRYSLATFICLLQLQLDQAGSKLFSILGCLNFRCAYLNTYIRKWLCNGAEQLATVNWRKWLLLVVQWQELPFLHVWKRVWTKILVQRMSQCNGLKQTINFLGCILLTNNKWYSMFF